MHKHKQVKRVSAAALALLSAGFLTTPCQAMAADVPDSAQVSQLLSEAKAQAFQLKEDAATLQSFTGSNLGWQSHAAVVNQMKEHVNAWATSLPSWKKTAESASPWQQTAIAFRSPQRLSSPAVHIGRLL